MPSPFPGMDPYLENPALWPGLHQLLISRALTTLNAVLPERYVANIGERLYVLDSERGIYPDLAVVERPAPAADRPHEAGIATIDPPMIVIAEPVEVREPFLEILDIADASRVVTVVEVLSPSNKASGLGRELYRTKQRELLRSRTHLLEIDLLHDGLPTIAAPLDADRNSGRYRICLHRAGLGNRFEVWSVSLRERLPRVAVPLAAGDDDLAMDLQTLFELCHDEAAYRRRLDYRVPPVVTLGEDAEWVDARLRESGFRP